MYSAEEFIVSFYELPKVYCDDFFNLLEKYANCGALNASEYARSLYLYISHGNELNYISEWMGF